MTSWSVMGGRCWSPTRRRSRGSRRWRARPTRSTAGCWPSCRSVGSKIADIEKSDMSDREKLNIKDELLQDYSVKSERVHTMTQLLKAWTLFDRDTEYIVVDNKVKIVDEQTGRVLEGRRY